MIYALLNILEIDMIAGIGFIIFITNLAFILKPYCKGYISRAFKIDVSNHCRVNQITHTSSTETSSAV